MLIRNFNSATSLENNKLADCGIIKYKRVIYLFVDPNAYGNNFIKTAKAVIINSSVNKGSKEGNIIHPSVDNSVMIRYSLYFCNVFFEESNNIKLSQFTVKNAYSHEMQTLFDQKQSANFMFGMYSSSLGKLEYDNEYLFWEIVGNMDTTVLPPIYYTEMHQYKITGDLFSLCGIGEIYSGSELIDNKTTIEYKDINSIDTMKYNFLGIMQSVEQKNGETLNVLNDFYHDFRDFIGKNCYFVYDSDGNGINNRGVNIVDGKIDYKSFYLPQYIRNNVTSALTLFEQSCRDIEDKYGHIKVLCYPDKIGNKTKIKFKDYNRYPEELKPLGYIDHDGNSLSSSDSGFHIEKQVDEVLDNLQTGNDSYY
jgi:hypothetical protein